MAESTEQEQIKQTQVMESVDKGQAAVSGKLDKVIAVLKEEGTQEALLTEMKEQDEVLLKAVKGFKGTQEELKNVTEKIHKQGKDGQQATTDAIIEQTEVTTTATEEQTEKVVELSDKTVNTLNKGNDILEAFKVAQAETADKTSSYQDIMEGIENKKADLAAGALADTKRSDKLAKREDGKVWGWVKDKGTAVKKMAGTFFENLMKLLGLLMLWFALSWLKGKDLKKIWEKFKEKVQEIIDDWIPQWIQDLSFGEAVTVAVAALATAFATWKIAVWGAKEVLKKSWNGIKNAFGWRGTISSQLDDVNRSIAKLAKEKNMMKKAMDLETDIGKKSALATQIDEMDVAMQELVDQENALKKSKKLKTHLDLDGDLSKQLQTVDDDLTKLAADKDNLMKKTEALKGKLDADSPLSKQLDEVLDSMTELKQQRGVLQKTIEMNRMTVKNLQDEAADAAKKAAEAKTAKKPGALMSAEEILDRKLPGGRAGIVQGKVPPVPAGAIDEVVKSPGWFKSLLNAVTDSKVWKSAKGLGKIGLKAADIIVTKILAPLEAVRGVRAGWKATEGEDWDVRVKSAGQGMLANLADLAVTDTLRGAEALSGMFQDWYNDREFGTTVVDYNAKEAKAYFEEKLGAFKTGTTLESMLESGEISWWDLTGFGKGGTKLYTDKLWELQADTQKGALKDLIEERKQQRINAAKRTGKEGWDQGKHAGEDLSLFIADLDKSAAIKFLMEMTKKTDQDRQGRLSAISRSGAPKVNNTTIVKKEIQAVAKSNPTDQNAKGFIRRVRGVAIVGG
jgi:hypothetical protein